jgi:hypothetical protein
MEMSGEFHVPLEQDNYFIRADVIIALQALPFLPVITSVVAEWNTTIRSYGRSDISSAFSSQRHKAFVMVHK